MRIESHRIRCAPTMDVPSLELKVMVWTFFAAYRRRNIAASGERPVTKFSYLS